MVERKVQILPGYDCRVECKHERKGNHGIGAEAWFFVVTDGDRAVSLKVTSGQYPPSVAHSSDPPEGWCLATHVADPEGTACDYVAGGRCRGDFGFLMAGEFWEQWGKPELRTEQPESFWKALEARLPQPGGSGEVD